MAKDKQVGMSADEFESHYDPADEVRSLRIQVKQAEDALEEYRKEHGSLKVLFSELADHVDAILPKPIKYRPPSGTKTKKEVHTCSVWGDWHNGAVQDANEIEGFNEFSPELLRNRILNCKDDQLDWVKVERNAHNIPVSHDLFVGDLISGDIHEELRVTNKYPAPVQAIRAGYLVAEMLAAKAPFFERVEADFVTLDNHGRLTKKPQAKEGGLNTWMFVTATIAYERLREIPNVDFRIHPVGQKVVDVNGRRYMLLHGHQVRGWAGFPYYGIQRKVGQEAAKRMRRDLAKFHRIVMGHWHAPLQHPWYWINGSASGTDTFDHLNGRESSPSQSSWLVHPEHGEFNRTDWNLRDDPV